MMQGQELKQSMHPHSCAHRCNWHAQLCLCVCLLLPGHVMELCMGIHACSLISDDLRKGLVDRAEHTFQLALTLAVGSGVAAMVLMEVSMVDGGTGLSKV